MTTRWISFFVVFCLGVFVFALFWIRIQPIEIPNTLADAPEPGSIEEPMVTFVNPSLGAENPTVHIIEYGDFECEACKKFGTAVEVVLKAHPEHVRFTWKNMPNESLHPLATPAAIAAHCADRQDAFWAFYDELYNRQTFLSEDQFSQIATTVGINEERFTRCYNDRDTLPIVTKDFEEGVGLGITATPTIFINGERYVGGMTTERLIELVEAELN